MAARLKVAARWVLVLATLSATSLMLFMFLMGRMLWPGSVTVSGDGEPFFAQNWLGEEERRVDSIRIASLQK